MTNSREQQGFPPRVIVSGGNMHGLVRGQACRVYPIPESQPILTDTVYLSLSESNALLAEAVRVAKERLRDEISERVDQKLQRIMAGNLSVLVDSYRRQINSVIEAASADGGKGGGE